MKEFTRKLKLKETFHEHSYEDESFVKKKSKMNPKTNNKELCEIISLIENTDPTETTFKDNLSKEERKSLKELKDLDDIIFKKADKGDIVVILEKDFYRDKLVLEPHLNTLTYQKVDSKADQAVFRKLKVLMNKHKENLTKKEYSYITDFDWDSSNFYVLPKIHKNKTIIEKLKKENGEYIEMIPPNDLQARPIVAGCNSPTQKLSELLEKILSPIVPELKSYIKDDWDLLRKLPQEFHPTCHLYSCDIVSLYTSITHELGERALKYWLIKKRYLIPARFTDQFIIESALFVLKNNNFLFDNAMYNQLIGTAMGTKFAPPYACLVVGYLEETKLYPELYLRFPEEFCKYLIENFFRFMDDGLTPWLEFLDITIFEHILNNLDENIEFTLEAATIQLDENGNYVQSLNFLDINLLVHTSGKLETNVYYKPTNTHEYLPFNSHHPKHIKANIPYNL